jgi:hypothetical protein
MKTVILAIASIVMFLSSCQRCIKCEYTDRYDKIHTEDLCGNKDDIEALSQAYKDSSNAHSSRSFCSEDF